MRILVVEDDYLIAQLLVRDICKLGDTVIGPFARPADAVAQVAKADAAILDIQLGGQTSFAIADELRSLKLPFVFLTGQGMTGVPSRFQSQPVHSKPSPTRSILMDLHDRHLRCNDRGSAREILIDMLAYARLKVSDRSAADRLVEAVMLKAIARTKNENALVGDLRPLLIDLLDGEIAVNLRRYLH